MVNCVDPVSFQMRDMVCRDFKNYQPEKLTKDLLWLNCDVREIMKDNGCGYHLMQALE